MGANTEDLVPSAYRKKGRFELNLVDLGLLIDFFVPIPKPRSQTQPHLANVRVDPHLSVLINTVLGEVTVWGANRCSYKSRHGVRTEDRSGIITCRRPLHLELPATKPQRMLYHLEVNHDWVRGSKSGRNIFLVATNPIRVSIDHSHVSVQYANDVYIWNGMNPKDMIHLHDSNDIVVDFRPDELFLTEQEEQPRPVALPLTSAS